MLIRHLLKAFTTSNQRNKIRKCKRKLKAILYPVKKTTLSELKDILVNDLGIKAGDNILVASSFGNLNANYSPKDVITLLQSIVTEEGAIMMPYYPPINSTEWAEKGCVFDMKTTKSGMGVLTNVFSKMPGVLKSTHPTKAVCVWGKNAEKIIANHEKSTTPFYWDSPYGKFFKIGSKSLGLGVKNIPICHTIEDVLSKHYYNYYQKEKYSLVIQDGDIKNIVNTYIHDSVIMDKCISPGDYVASLKCETYKKVDFGHSFLYIIDNNDLFERMKIEFAKGNTRIRK